MKAYLDWLDAEGRVSSREVPAGGFNVSLDLGPPGAEAGMGQSGSAVVVDCEFGWDGRLGTVRTPGFEMRLAGEPVEPGRTINLDNNIEIEIGSHRLRFRRVPAVPTVAGEATPEYDLSTLDGARLVVGRHRDSAPEEASDGIVERRWDLDPADRSISHRHVEITADRQRGGYDVTDVSRSGAELNGRGFKKVHLVLGDRIRIGDYWFEFTGQGLRWGDEWSGGSLRAKNLRVVVPTSKGPRPILHGMSLSVRSGEFIGILGGSGQGKSTLLNALCGINPATSGEVWINDVPLKSRSQMRDLAISFVPQDDLVHRELTVDEAILFSAKLRLKIRGAPLRILVDGVIERLMLGEHRHKRISTLSGGQRKRVSIATELLARPSILFLDEPTSGLDPAIERLLMIDLQRLSLTGVTIVTVTHVLQSAYLFSRICYIHDGRLLFMGKVEQARDFFFSSLSADSSAGDIGRRRGSSTGSSAGGPPSQGSTAGGDSSRPHTLIPLERIYTLFSGRNHQASAWEEAFNTSSIASSQQHHFPLPPPVFEHERPRLGAGFLPSLILLVRRQWRIIVADRMNVLFLFAQALLIGGLVGWVSDDTGFRLFLAVIATMWFGCSNAAQQIVGELPILRRERVSGLGLNCYIQSKFLFLFGITAIQACLLLASLTTAASLAHPVEIDRTKFVKDLREREASTGAPVESRDTDMPQGDYAEPVPMDEDEEEESRRTVYRRTAYISAPEPLNPTWFESFAWWTARHFSLDMNLLDSGSERVPIGPVQAMRTGQPLGTEVPSPGLHVAHVLATCLGLRVAALLLAALAGVGLGLMISALAQSGTQAVLWVPLILIPQILLGGFVVTLPEMSRAVRAFSSLMPSFAAEKLMEVSHIYGQRVPLLTNQTRIPNFMTKERAPNGDEEVSWTDMRTGESGRETYEKMSPHNTAWQNLTLLVDRLGARSIEIDEGTKPSTVKRRSDVSPHYPYSHLFRDATPAIPPLIVLGGWIAGCYLVILIALNRRQYGK